MKGAAIVFDALTVEQSATFEFDVWYANRYLPAMLQGGRCLGLRRYGSPLRGAYLAIFEAAAAPAAAAPGIAQHGSLLGTERYIAQQIAEQSAPHAPRDAIEADILYPVFFRVPAEREAEFDAWYGEEHLGILLGSRYWPYCRRFKVMDAGDRGPTHIALHYLTDLRALESDERDRARATPWRARLAAEPWFRGDYRVYYRYGALHLPGNTPAR